MPCITPAQAGGTNRCAFLDMIAVSEIGASQLLLTHDGYNVLVGSTSSKLLTFSSYATHPNIYNQRLDSTAAGRYQLLYRYWVAYKASLSLPDFSPLSQDLIALQQIRERNALSLIDAGNFEAAVHAVSNIWASLPGSPYGQRTNDLAALQAAYVERGGIVS